MLIIKNNDFGDILCRTAIYNGNFDSTQKNYSVTINNNDLTWEDSPFTILGEYLTGERIGNNTITFDNKTLIFTTTSTGATTSTTTIGRFIGDSTYNYTSSTAGKQRVNYVVAIIDNNNNIAIKLQNTQDIAYTSTYGVNVTAHCTSATNGVGITYLNEPPSTPSVILDFKSEVNNFLKQVSIYKDPTITDPYDENGTSDTGGGGGIGTASDTSDSIDFPDVPTLSAVATGFINLYTPTLSELQSLANFMWSSAFDLDTLKKLFSDPMQSILGLSILGVQAPTGSSKTVVVGDISTGVSMTTVPEGQQYFKINCGSLNIQEIWGAYLDYAPYTKVSVYLPFIGTHALNIDEIMNKTIELEYMVDALSGACIANIKSGIAVLYSFIGQCSASLPISGNDYTSMINGVLGIAGAVGSMVATGGSTAPLVLPGVAATAVNSLKPSIEHSGAISGTGGIMGIKTPYLIFERPRQCLPSNQNKYIGYPSYITENIGDLSGFTVFQDIKIQGNSHMTMGEIEEIEAIFKSGVYL